MITVNRPGQAQEQHSSRKGLLHGRPPPKGTIPSLRGLKQDNAFHVQLNPFPCVPPTPPSILHLGNLCLNVGFAGGRDASLDVGLVALLLTLTDTLSQKLGVLSSSLNDSLSLNSFRKSNHQQTAHLLLVLSVALLQCEPVALVLESAGSDEALDLRRLGLGLLPLLGGDLTANDVLADVVLLGKSLRKKQT